MAAQSQLEPRPPVSVALRLTIQTLDSHVPIPNLVAVILQHHMATPVSAELLPGSKFAGRDPLLPIGAPQVVFRDFGTVEIVLDMIMGDHDPRIVPTARRLGHIFARRIKTIDRRCRRNRACAISMTPSIDDLA